MSDEDPIDLSKMDDFTASDLKKATEQFWAPVISASKGLVDNLSHPLIKRCLEIIKEYEDKIKKDELDSIYLDLRLRSSIVELDDGTHVNAHAYIEGLKTDEGRN